MREPRGELRCTLVALLAAWVAMVFGTSALLVLELLLIAIFAALVVTGERPGGTRTPWQRYTVNIGLGVAAVLLTLALVPAALSRGFGVGLTGARLDPSALPWYVVGGALGAVAFTVSVARCRKRRLPAAGG